MGNTGVSPPPLSNNSFLLSIYFPFPYFSLYLLVVPGLYHPFFSIIVDAKPLHPSLLPPPLSSTTSVAITISFYLTYFILRHFLPPPPPSNKISLPKQYIFIPTWQIKKNRVPRKIVVNSMLPLLKFVKLYDGCRKFSVVIFSYILSNMSELLASLTLQEIKYEFIRLYIRPNAYIEPYSYTISHRMYVQLNMYLCVYATTSFVYI